VKEFLMHSKLLNDDGQKTWVVIFDTGDEFMSGMQRFAEENRLDASHLTAIGAFSRATLAFFDTDAKEYHEIPVDEQIEVLSLVGDIANHEGKPKLHAHVVVGRADGTTRGGHILEAHVRPTLEVILTESPKHLKRKTDPETGLALISL
jgi:predicted DNA-binding protein with PD1-like motif